MNIKKKNLKKSIVLLAIGLIVALFTFNFQFYQSEQNSFIDKAFAASAPTLVSKPATSISTNSANAIGNVSSDGGSPLTEAGAYLYTGGVLAQTYCQSDTPGNWISDLLYSGFRTKYTASSIPTVGTDFTTPMTGLSVYTPYYFKSYAKNSVGASYGGCTKVTTLDLQIAINFSANPTSVDYGQTTALSWNVQNADSCAANNDGLANWSGAVSNTGGTQAITISKKTQFNLTCRRTVSGQSLTALATVAINGGTCAYGGGGTIQAMFFCKGTMSVADNSEMIGSFVAKNFSESANLANVNFFSDPNFDSLIPPGFKFLTIPVSAETGNKK